MRFIGLGVSLLCIVALYLDLELRLDARLARGSAVGDKGMGETLRTGRGGKQGCWRGLRRPRRPSLYPTAQLGPTLIAQPLRSRLSSVEDVLTVSDLAHSGLGVAIGAKEVSASSASSRYAGANPTDDGRCLGSVESNHGKMDKV